jgi:hypothetical protein
MENRLLPLPSGKKWWNRDPRPADVGIMRRNSAGMCIYCQLIMHPDAQGSLKHQPTWMSLERSAFTCQLCQIILSVLWDKAKGQKLRLDIIRLSEVLELIPDAKRVCCFETSTAISVHVMAPVDSQEAKAVHKRLGISCESRGRPTLKPDTPYGIKEISKWYKSLSRQICFCTEDYLGLYYILLYN